MRGQAKAVAAELLHVRPQLVNWLMSLVDDVGVADTLQAVIDDADDDGRGG
jgi:hypothetical protein